MADPARFLLQWLDGAGTPAGKPVNMVDRPLVAGEGATLDAAGILAAPAGHLVAWSGTLADAPFASHPLTWSTRGWAALHAACDALTRTLTESGRTLLVRTHARHVLSDPRACLKFAAERGPASPVVVLPDIAAMIDVSMLPTVDDHLERLFATLPSIAGAAGAVLANVARAAEAPDAGPDELGAGPAASPAPIHRGAVPVSLLVAGWQAHMPADAPMVLLGDDLPDQLAALAAAGRNH